MWQVYVVCGPMVVNVGLTLDQQQLIDSRCCGALSFPVECCTSLKYDCRSNFGFNGPSDWQQPKGFHQNSVEQGGLGILWNVRMVPVLRATIF